MEEKPTGPTPDPSKRFVRFGILISASYLLAVAVYAIFVRENILTLAPDEFATFVAGAFSPLAFLWLVLGFFQQGQELRQSSQALWLQGEELRNSVEQQRSLVEVSRQQLEFERERIDVELATSKRRAQPDFVVTGGGYSSLGHETALMNFRLMNRGPKCTDVRFYVTEQTVLRYPLMESGSSHEFNIEIGPNHVLGDRPFKVEYIDALGEPGEDVVVLEAYLSGSRKLLRVPS